MNREEGREKEPESERGPNEGKRASGGRSKTMRRSEGAEQEGVRHGRQTGFGRRPLIMEPKKGWERVASPPQRGGGDDCDENSQRKVYWSKRSDRNGRDAAGRRASSR